MERRDIKKISLRAAFFDAFFAFRKQWETLALIGLHIVLFDTWIGYFMLSEQLWMGFLKYLKDPVILMLMIGGAIFFGLIVRSYLLVMIVDYSLQAIDKPDREIIWRLPTRDQFYAMMGTSILNVLYVVLGISLFVIPGLYVMLKLAFFEFVVIDQQLTGKQALKAAWYMTPFAVWWRLSMIIALINIIAFLPMGWLLGIICYPFFWYVSAALYRQVLARH